MILKRLLMTIGLGLLALAVLILATQGRSVQKQVLLAQRVYGAPTIGAAVPSLIRVVIYES